MSFQTIRPIAFYLPQFHPIPENDAWWGRGFTEWTSVSRARPLLPGHDQPHLPADLGFYDLRVPEVREQQAAMAREAGIYAFCYYHYWFNGKRLLQRPFEEVLASGRPDYPFCLCWANENWTRRWDGLQQEILIAQCYQEEDDRQHVRALATAFRDPRYLRVDGRPIFLIYRASLFPDVRRMTEVWREEARRLGLGELYLCRVESFPEEQGDPQALGFDASVEFQPRWGDLGPPLRRGRRWRWLTRWGLSPRAYQDHNIYDYAQLVERMLDREAPGYKRFPCVTPSWDNTARRKAGALVFLNNTPELYETWLTTALRRFQPFSADENLFFINAWNEWAEGNHLEPCQRWGMAYLEATRRALEGD